jgi:hypothetical protein
MHRLLALSVTLLTPLSAFAFYATPSALVRGVHFDGNPRSFEGQAHFHAEGHYVSLWMKGATEGRTPAALKAKLQATIDVADWRATVRTRFAFMVYQGNVYAKLLSVEGPHDGDTRALRSLAEKPWLMAPMEAGGKETLTETLTGMLRDAGISAAESDVQALFDQITDAVFTMTHSRYQGGNAFSLKLSPAFLTNVLDILGRSPLFHEMIGQIHAWEPGDAREIRDVQDMLKRAINLHVKVNTNTVGEFLYGKKYIAFHHEGLSFVFEGTAQHQPTPVYLDIPKKTMDLDELHAALLATSMWTDLFEFLPVRGVHKPMKGWAPTWEPLIEEDEDIRMPVQPPMSRPRRTPVGRSVDSYKATSQPAQCMTEPGTPAYLQETRKGLCLLPQRSLYRINDQSTGKVLNPRTTRLKNPNLGR